MQGTTSWRNGRDDGGARIGAVVGGWTIERLLGSGPVCDSWLAVRGEQRAVVRRPRAPYADDRAARVEWLRASWSANRFHHARIVKVIEQAVDGDGVPVVIRGFSRGEPLEDAARRGAVDVAGALRLAERLLDVLEMAHAHGILHGALTPTNVLLTPRGSVRVVDFATTPGLLARRTGASGLLATARGGPFFAPERCTRPPAPPSEQADVWSVGACLHLALGGGEPPADARPLAGVGEDVAAVVAMALARDPLQRYESAYAMLGDVRRLLAGRKPKLDGSLAPVPSQSLAQVPLLVPEPPSPPSSSRMRPVPDLPQAAPTAAPVRPASREWLGNLLLVLAIALLVALAAYVVVRERLADHRGASRSMNAVTSPATAPRSPSQAST